MKLDGILDWEGSYKKLRGAGAGREMRYGFVVESDLIFLDVTVALWLCDFRRCLPVCRV